MELNKATKKVLALIVFIGCYLLSIILIGKIMDYYTLMDHNIVRVGDNPHRLYIMYICLFLTIVPLIYFVEEAFRNKKDDPFPKVIPSDAKEANCVWCPTCEKIYSPDELIAETDLEYPHGPVGVYKQAYKCKACKTVYAIKRDFSHD